MKQINVTELNVIGEQYESFDEFYRVNEARGFNEHYSSDRDCGKGSMRNVKDDLKYDWDDTKRDIRLGSELFSDEFKSVLAEVENEIPSAWKNGMRARTEKSVVGQSVSVGRALVNNPRAFNRKVPQRLKQKTVSFFFSVACPWSTPTRDRLKAGCILMAICQHLERQGYQTRIYYSPMFSSGKESGNRDQKYPSQVVMMLLKDFKTRFNLKKMQFPLAGESALFHAGCWWVHRFPGTTFDWGYGEGYAVDNDSLRLKDAKDFAKRYDSIYLSIPMIRKDHEMSLMNVYRYVMEQIGEM